MPADTHHADMNVSIRPAEPPDVEDVVAFTRDTWSEYEGGDYLPDVFPRWVEDEDPERRTFVADAGGRAVGTLQAVLLSSHEAWLQGLRVDPEYRGEGIGTRLTHAGFRWARGKGASVARSMVFSWNESGLGLARAAGFEPAMEFRPAHPEPDPDASVDGPADSIGTGIEVTADPGAAWAYWNRSDTREHLSGLALDPGESWAASDLTLDQLRRAATETSLLALRDDGTRGFAHRVRIHERETEDGETEQWAVYGVAAWSDPGACEALMAAIARDAADCGADRTRVAVPETVAAVSDVALAGHPVAGDPDFVLAADLTRDFGYG
ncbi:MAG: N-acetyltransferase family protein [Halobacteriales archaeon]